MSSSGTEKVDENKVHVSGAQSEADEELVHSLGEALAGVNLGNQNHGNYSSGVASSPFAIGSRSKHQDGWSSFDEGATLPSFATSAPDDAGIEQGLQLFLSEGSKQALDGFGINGSLSLGSGEQRHPDTSSAFRFPGQGSSHNASNVNDARADGRRESPSTSITGTNSSSRSVSPYTSGAGDNRKIQAYRPETFSTEFNKKPSFSEDENYSIPRQGSYPSLHSLDSARRSPFGKDSVTPANTASFSQSFSRNSSFSQPQQLHTEANSGQGGQPQVLFMAVPAPDGRGQVLQPVQIMQTPGGKPYTYVVPGSNDTKQSSVALPPFGQSQGGLDAARGQFDSSRAFEPSAFGDAYGALQPGPDPFQGDPALSSLYSSPQRPSLDALVGQVRRLSRDQVGCRLVQQALDEEGPTAATLILKEGLPFWGEAMIDPFGNYLFQKILEKITAEERVMLVKSVSSRLVNASLNLHGTRSVQKVVELCAADEEKGLKSEDGESAADILAQALTPAAARLCIDSHGNHVIQRILLKLGPRHSQFIFDAVAASVGDVARHRHGCCVIQRCLDFNDFKARRYLVERIVESSFELMQDAYGNYVVQYVLDVCSDHDVQAVCESVVGRVNLLSIQKFSSNVMEKCLERCNERVKAMYLDEISDTERIRELMMDPFGNYVVQRALSVATHTQAVRLVEAMKPHLIAQQSMGPHGQRNGGVRNTAGGRRIIAKICRRFPNFSLNEMVPQEEIYGQGPARHNNNQFQRHRPGPTGYGQAPAPGMQQHYNGGGHRMQGGNYHMPHQQQQYQQQQQQQPYYNVGGDGQYDRYGGHSYGGYGF